MTDEAPPFENEDDRFLNAVYQLAGFETDRIVDGKSTLEGTRRVLAELRLQFIKAITLKEDMEFLEHPPAGIAESFDQYIQGLLAKGGFDRSMRGRIEVLGGFKAALVLTHAVVMQEEDEELSAATDGLTPVGRLADYYNRAFLAVDRDMDRIDRAIDDALDRGFLR